MTGAIFTHTRTVGTSADHASPQAWDDYAPGTIANTWRVSIGSITGGPFTAGEALSFSSSSATGYYLDDDGSQMVFEVLTGTPTTADTISGDTSSASCALNVIDDDLGIIYQANQKDEALTGVSLVIDGSTTASGTYKEYTADGTSGFESFIDHKADVGFRLDYNSSGGARLEATSGTLLQVNDTFTRINRMQFKTTGNYTSPVVCGVASNLFEKCIVERGGGSSVALNAFSSTAINCLLIHKGSATGTAGSTSYGTKYINCTSVKPSGITAGGTGFSEGGSTTNKVIHCAAFNFSNGFTASGWHADSDWNASDDTTGPGANSVDSLTYADQYGSTTNDWLLKSGNGLGDAGESVDGDLPSEDILENARPAGGASNPVAIGCVELIAAVGGLSIPIAAYHYNHHLGSMN